MSIQDRIYQAVQAGALTVKDVAALLEDLSEHQISGHLSNLAAAGRIRRCGSVNYGGRRTNQYEAVS